MSTALQQAIGKQLAFRLCNALHLFSITNLPAFSAFPNHPRVYNRGLVLARLQMELQDTGPLKVPWRDCMLGPGQKVTASWRRAALYSWGLILMTEYIQCAMCISILSFIMMMIIIFTIIIYYCYLLFILFKCFLLVYYILLFIIYGLLYIYYLSCII
jgi:hypothetical protein